MAPTATRIAAVAVAALSVAALVTVAANAPIDPTPGVGEATPSTRGVPSTPTASGAEPGGGWSATPTAPVDFETGVEQLHARGVTGDGVAVGVIDVTGFDAGHPDLAGRVEATRAFGEDADARGGPNSHGTAAAATVAGVAPDADLLLATVASHREFGRAVEWLVDRGVDVIVAPVSFYGRSDDGTSPAARAAARAADRGVVFVAPAGNLGHRHWAGRYRPVDDGAPAAERIPADVDGGALAFEDGPRNYLGGEGRRLVVWMYEDDGDREGGDDEYGVALYRDRGDGVERVAVSSPYRGDGEPNHRLEATVDPDGSYFLVVEGPDAATGTALELESPTHRFEHSRPAGSLTAPATARDALVVGAAGVDGGRPADYASRGPTTDGRPGVDVVAPAVPPSSVDRGGDVGSSYAAPRVAGVAALLLSARSRLAPGHVEEAVALTAVDVGRPGYDLAAGHGRVAPPRAWRFVGATPDGASHGSGDRTAGERGVTSADWRVAPDDRGVDTDEQSVASEAGTSPPTEGRRARGTEERGREAALRPDRVRFDSNRRLILENV